MKIKISKTEANKQINKFFENIKNKTPKEIKKIKKLTMAKNIYLKEKRKLFCKKCFSVHKTPKIRINNKIKRTICENCGYCSRWMLHN